MNFSLMNCSHEDAKYICDKLVKYNLSQVPMTQDTEFVFINKKMVNEDNKIVAGCIAKMYCWNVIYIDILWVEEGYRTVGIGSTLLKEIEEIAKEERCNLIHLDTFDFQAKDFYLKHGYEVFGALEDCPKGHCRYFLKKVLE